MHCTDDPLNGRSIPSGPIGLRTRVSARITSSPLLVCGYTIGSDEELGAIKHEGLVLSAEGEAPKFEFSMAPRFALPGSALPFP